MRKVSLVAVLALMVTLLNSCQVIGDIFKAGVWVGIIIVIVVVFLIFWLISKFRG